MANKIKLFGDNLNTFPNWTTTSNGIRFNDSQWEAASVGNSSIRNTGFIPNAPISSVALNTALRQASIGSKILGDILSDSNLGIYTQGDIGADDLTKVTDYSNALTNYLLKINGLLDGTVKASIAQNYDTTSGTIKSSFDNAIQQITAVETEKTQQINQLKLNVENGDVVAGTAVKYYTPGGSYSIADKITQINNRLDGLGMASGSMTGFKSGTTPFTYKRCGKFVIIYIDSATQYKFDSYTTSHTIFMQSPACFSKYNAEFLIKGGSSNESFLIKFYANSNQVDIQGYQGTFNFMWLTTSQIGIEIV